MNLKELTFPANMLKLARWVIKEHVEHSVKGQRVIYHIIRHVKKHAKKRNILKLHVTRTNLHNESNSRQHYWFIIACACAIPVLLQLCESSFKGLKYIMYSLPVNILQPCHPCPFWLISLLIHYSFSRPLPCIFMICAWHENKILTQNLSLV